MVSADLGMERALAAAALIGVDWGSTGLRVFLIDVHGLVLVARSSADGASTLSGTAEFQAALDRLAGDWLSARPNLPVVGCGMVGSQHGWQQVPYLRCPADPAQLGAALSAVGGARLQIVPGVQYVPDDGAPDLMRGEETQIVGALQVQSDLTTRSCIVMPGTHSKWVQIEDSRIGRFATHMTGELFAVLRQHSVLGRTMPARQLQADMASFTAGVDAARNAAHLGLGHQLFAVRSLVLTEKMSAAGAADYLSGLLIGHELQAGLAWRRALQLDTSALALVGEPALCQLYGQALTRLGARADFMLPNTAPSGLWRIASAAGLLRSPAASILESTR